MVIKKETKILIHSIIIIFTIALGFLLPKTTLVNFELELIAGLFIILYLSKKFFILKSPKTRLMESVIFTLVVLWVVNTTGGINSAFFFLLYFLLFSTALLLEPIISLITSLTLIVFFLFNLPSTNNFQVILPLISLAMITPFSLFLGKEYLDLQKEKEKEITLKKNTFLFLSLIIKNHLKNINQAVENFVGDHQLSQIKTNVKKLLKLIDEFERKD